MDKKTAADVEMQKQKILKYIKKKTDIKKNKRPVTYS